MTTIEINKRVYRPTAYTLMEILIAASILSLFMVGLMALFRSGQQAGAQGLWLQKTVSELRNASRHISTTLARTSFPSTIVFPDTIIENDSDDFKVHYSGNSPIIATRSKSISGISNPATQFLRFTESMPERSSDGKITTSALLTYHVYSLSADGRLLYHKYERTVPPTSPPDYIKNISEKQVPSTQMTLAERHVLVTDVETVAIDISSTTASITPLIIDITCAWPHGRTKRNERIVGSPNVPAIIHPTSDPDWQLK